MRRLALLSLPVVVLAAALARAGEGDTKLTFDTPKEWKEGEVKGGAMAAKKLWTLDKAEGDSEAPTVKIFHFGGQGGSLDDNVKRWVSQFKTADGKEIPAKDVKKETFEVGKDIKVTTVEIAGTFTPPAMTGGGDPKKGQKLIGAYVEGKGGPWFIKLQGPEKSVDKNKEAFVKWLKSGKLAVESK